MTRPIAIVVLGLFLGVPGHRAGPHAASGTDASTAPRPVASTGSGLLLEPPVDLARFTREDFEAYSATVGPAKIRRPWTSAITPLPSHPRAEAHGLTEPEIKETMLRLRDLFDQGKSVPVSDVGLISTQEDVIRKPMYNHVAAFANPTVNAYLLVQSIAGSGHWGYFAIVQDRTTEPPTDHFAEIMGDRVKFEGTSCYKCHSSGPLAIHPTRADLVSDRPLLAAINRQIADQPQSRFHFPPGDPPPDYGPPLALMACTKCHDLDAMRGPLFRAQAHPIRVLVDYGYMPPNRRLNPQELGELRAWLEGGKDAQKR